MFSFRRITAEIADAEAEEITAMTRDPEERTEEEVPTAEEEHPISRRVHSKVDVLPTVREVRLREEESTMTDVPVTIADRRAAKSAILQGLKPAEHLHLRMSEGST